AREAVGGEREIFRPVLVAHQLLSSARAGGDCTLQPRLSSRVHRGDDVEGPATGPGGGHRRKSGDAAGRGGRRALRPVRGGRQWRRRFLGHHPHDPRRGRQGGRSVTRWIGMTVPGLVASCCIMSSSIIGWAVRGLSCLPSSNTWKQRCGPVARPVIPTKPIKSPCLTWAPVLAVEAMAERWAYPV